jgi:glycosyltransferase involved in cell wall biosynthesis
MLALGWLWQLVQWLRHARTLPDLTCPQDDWQIAPVSKAEGKPQLTVIVPACNEEGSIEATLRSLLGSAGIRLEIIAVDDRSTDRTGAILDEVSSQLSGLVCGHKLAVLHIRELPAGWLGKPHALWQGAQRAQADWILFTDADVVFAPQAAALALAYAEAECADHVVLMPDWILGSHGEAAMLGAIHALTSWGMRLWRVADPDSRDFLGVGAFNLVRRSAYEALGGFEALRMEVLEDLRLGWKLKRAGYRQRVALGPGLASIRWSFGAWSVVRNLEKNLFALYRYRVGLTLLGCLGLSVQIALPIMALFAGGWARIGAIAVYGAVVGIYCSARRVTRVAPTYVLVYPLAASLFLFAVVRSMSLALVRGGVAWRGTLYSLRELREHAGRFW